MDQPKDQQPRGDFVAFMNRDKQPGDNRPAFEGRITKPGSDEKLPLTLWAHEYADPKTGEVKVMFSGTIGAIATNAAPTQQIAALAAAAAPTPSDAQLGGLTLSPRQVVLFPNGFKNEAPDKDRPDYWGAYNPGDGSPVVRISTWLKKDRNGKAYLTGATQYSIPDKTEAEMQSTDHGLAELVARGDVSQGMPEKKRGKGRSE